MRKLFLLTGAAMLMANTAMATVVERWSVQVGNTFVATVKVDGKVIQPGTNGLTSDIALSERATRAWAEQRYDNVRVKPFRQFIRGDGLFGN